MTRKPNNDEFPSLKFFNGQFLFEFHDEGGTHKKFVSPAAVRQAFAGQSFDSGWLTHNVIRCGASVTGEWAVMEIAPSVRSILLDDGGKKGVRRISVPLPRLLMFGIASTWYVWALREKSLLAKAEVFAAPLPNVHQNGSICFGKNKPPKASGFSIDKAWDLFITSPFNGDLAGQKSAKHKDIRTGLVQLAKDKATEYPTQDLVKLRNHGSTTLDVLIKSLTGESEQADMDYDDDDSDD